MPTLSGKTWGRKRRGWERNQDRSLKKGVRENVEKRRGEKCSDYF